MKKSVLLFAMQLLFVGLSFGQPSNTSIKEDGFFKTYEDFEKMNTVSLGEIRAVEYGFIQLDDGTRRGDVVRVSKMDYWGCVVYHEYDSSYSYYRFIGEGAYQIASWGKIKLYSSTIFEIHRNQDGSLKEYYSPTGEAAWGITMRYSKGDDTTLTVVKKKYPKAAEIMFKDDKKAYDTFMELDKKGFQWVALFLATEQYNEAHK